MMSKSQIRAVSVHEIQALDRIAIEEIGIPSLSLMENAGRAVAQEALSALQGKKKPSVCVVCGTGNNAGDGFVVARHLMNKGIHVKVFLVGNENKLKHDALVHFRVLKKIKCPIQSAVILNRSNINELKTCDVIVDAIFGVGLNREILDPAKNIIASLNALRQRIISIDIPSGLDGTTGSIYGVCVKAWKTVTFSFMKKGFLKNLGPHYAGRVIIADIGIPPELIKRI